MINSDDFYGYDAFKVASEFLDKQTNDIAIIGYKVSNTLTENGSVKRGILEIDNNKLVRIIESKIENVNGVINAEPLSGEEAFTISEDELVSMNMIVFPKEFISYIEENFIEFLKHSDLLKDEYLIPDVVSKCNNEKLYNVIVEKTNSKWVGVTYKEDKDSVVNYINSLIEDGVYKSNLWE